jgi:hypothetical protein
MNREDLEHIIRAAAAASRKHWVSGHDRAGHKVTGEPKTGSHLRSAEPLPGRAR